MPWSNQTCAPQLLSLRSRAREPQLLNPRAASTEAHVPRSPRTATKSRPRSPQLEKARAQQRRPNTAKKKKKDSHLVFSAAGYSRAGAVFYQVRVKLREWPPLLPKLTLDSMAAGVVGSVWPLFAFGEELLVSLPSSVYAECWQPGPWASRHTSVYRFLQVDLVGASLPQPSSSSSLVSTRLHPFVGSPS